MQETSQDIYKTRTGQVLAITEIQARILNNKTVWKIPFDKDWEKLLYKIKQSYIKILQIYNPQSLGMFNCISSIHFCSLIQLNLARIELTTTEPILTLNSPNLQYIRLNSNQLSNIKALRKMNFLCLKELVLYNNRIIDCSPLVEVHSRQNLKIITSFSYKKPMTYRGSIFQTNPIQDYSILFKLKKNSEFVTKSLVCLNQEKLAPMFARKFVN